MSRRPSSPATTAAPASDCDKRCDLGGRCVLFVGGRKRHVCHFRQAVLERNGSFAAHDGGMEESMERLGQLFRRADMVVFPIGQVSHAAHDKVKAMCRQSETPFVALRGTGLAAFVQALDSLPSQTKGTQA